MANQEAKIDFRNVDASEIQKGKFPLKITEEYRVAIDEEAYDKMKAHAETTNKVELCGILVGQLLKDNKGIFLKIKAVIEGRDASSQGAQVTFTHQTWNHINDVMDKEYPNQQIIGWYHTHPGFGVFLSGMDLFIQENFFNQPHQIAIVIETHAQEEGCFVWVDGQSYPLERYWVGDKEVKLVGHQNNDIIQESNTIQLTQSAEMPSNEYNRTTPLNGGMNIQSILMSAMLLFLGYFAGQVIGLDKFKQSTLEQLESELHSIQEYASTNALAKEDLTLIRKKIGEIETKSNSERIIASKDLISQIKKLEIRYSNNRSQYRKNLQYLSQIKSTLSNRVKKNSHNSLETNDIMSDLYIFRLNDFMNSLKKQKVTKLNKVQLNELKTLSTTILRLSPRKKQLLFQMFPNLMPKVFPKKEKKATPKKKDEANTKEAQ